MDNQTKNVAWITPKTIRIASAMLIACGLLLVVVNFFTLETTVTHRARIVELMTTSEGIAPVVTFERHTDDMATRQIEPLKYPSRVSVGDEVKIYYYAEYYPRGIGLTTFWEFWLWSVVILVSGTIGLLVSYLPLFGKVSQPHAARTVIALVSAGLLLSGFLWIGFKGSRPLIREEATVIDFVTKNNGDILPIVQLNETTETREIEPLHYPARVHTGDTVQVYYVYPNSDDRLWIDSFWELWLRPVALLITGSAGVIVSSMLFIFGKKK